MGEMWVFYNKEIYFVGASLTFLSATEIRLSTLHACCNAGQNEFICY